MCQDPAPLRSRTSAARVFDLAAYDASPAEIEDFLQSSGLELSGSWASAGSDYTEPYANVTFSGTYDGDMPIE